MSGLGRQASFFVVGGSLDYNAPCYVPRQADDELYAGLAEGKFCYVLTTRQVGKSSLMVRTAARLRQEGAVVAVVDLTALGQNLTAEQWYDGMLSRIGKQLRLEDEVEDFWLDNERQSPLQRWMRAIRELVLTRCAGRVVIFIDEIDAVRSLPFSADEFFAGIREFYNRRTEDTDLNRLTFCLLGVATPSELMRDTRNAPFNIGLRIELTDFTSEEAARLAAGLGQKSDRARAIIKRALYWTGGHPYLTQRLCHVLSSSENVTGARGVDRVCREVFLSPHARDQDDNLLFVSNRLLWDKDRAAEVLDLYTKVRANKRVRNDESNPLITTLWLSGIARISDDYLYVRNRIYFRAFDRKWVKENMPGAEKKRQRAAYLRGLMLATAIATIIIFAITATAVYAFRQRNDANAALRKAEQAHAETLEAMKDAEKARADAAEARVALVEKEHLAESHHSLAEYERWRADFLTWEMIKDDSNPHTFRAYKLTAPPPDLAAKASARLKELAQSSGDSTSGVITGRVTDARTDQPVAGATITVWAQGLELSTVSNIDGQFIRALIPEGDYSITISHKDYEKKSSTISISPKKINKLGPEIGALRKKPG